MGRSVDDYRDALLALLPRGDAWSRDPDGELGKLMHGIAEEFARIDARAEDVLTESHPSTAFEMFEEWEAQYHLPDSCTVDPQFQQRVAALIQKYKMTGGQSRQFFEELAATLGYDVVISEYKERKFGGKHGERYGGTDWNFTWQVNALQANYQERSFGQPFGSTYRTWGSSGLECAFNRLVHSHRHIIYSYVPVTPEQVDRLVVAGTTMHNFIHKG